MQRLKLQIEGTVQGVGFRPFVYQLAQKLDLKGWVINSAAGVIVEVEGRRSPLNQFLDQLQTELPPNATIDRLSCEYLEPIGAQNFVIRRSEQGQKTALVLPDLATCSACLAEIFDPQNRRYHYPFTNCTHCGPRYSIIETLPYDRPLTSMADFSMCAACQREYEDPGDRRFHAQPNACPNCGPQLTFLTDTSTVLDPQQALDLAIQYLRAGKIIALKGLGGFQLLADAHNFQAVQQLRDRKQRPDKPFAVMFPNVEAIQAICSLSSLEHQLLISPAAPIILLQKKKVFNLAKNVAPNNPHLGVMLPYTPLHHLLLNALNFPFIATSGNLSDEPICIDETEALLRLKLIADGFLVHNRRILRPVDDSVVRVMHDQPILLRRARGYAPAPLTLQQSQLKHILAVGAQLKNTVAIALENRIFVSQHIGDLSNQLTLQAMDQTLQKLSQIYDFQPDLIACDLHPDYLSTQYAQNLAHRFNIPLVKVQHHHAHVYACIAEHQLQLPLLGIAWDGTGYGTDGTIWGSECFWVTTQGCERIAHIKPFPLLGGDQANREPRRCALGLLSQWFNLTEIEALNLSTLEAFSPQELSLLWSMLTKKMNAPLTSSMGRVFDAIASILGLYQRLSFEGQAAMGLEFLLEDVTTREAYPFALIPEEQRLLIDLERIIKALIQDLNNQISIQIISAKFHNTLVEIIAAIAQRQFAAKQLSQGSIVLTGGCFQNKYLLEQSIKTLQNLGFNVYYPQQFPPNDGAIALGQIASLLS